MSIKAFFAAMSLKMKVIAISSVTAIVAAAAVTAGVLLTKEEAYRVLKVFELTGSATVDRTGSGLLDAYVGMNLESGDTLTVGEDSTLRISLDSDKYVLLDSSTVLVLTATGTPSDSRTKIDLKQGTILNEITSSLSANSSYEVATPKATMAVRGTSFVVSVEEDEGGAYTIKTNTLHGSVEVTLIDSEGNATTDSALVTADKGVTVRTEPNEESGNPAEIDGTSFFVIEDESGSMVAVEDGGDPVTDIDYTAMSAVVKENALRSNDESLMPLDEQVVYKLRGIPAASADTQTSAAEDTSDDLPEDIPAAAVTAPPAAQVDTAPVVSPANEPVQSYGSQEEMQEDTPPQDDTANDDTYTYTQESDFEEEIVSAETQAPVETDETLPETFVTLPDDSETTADESVLATESSASDTLPLLTLPSTLPTVTAPIPSGTVSTAPEPVMHKVSFVCDGEIASSADIESGEMLQTIPAVPEKTGYTGKWMHNGAEVTAGTVVTEDMTITAVYTINTYTVTLTADADTAYSDSITAEHGTPLADILPEIPAKTGYTGVWKIGGTVTVSGDITLTSDLSITAVYTINTYTVTFTSDADTAYSNSITAQHGTPLADILPEIPAKTGYTGVWKIGGTVTVSGDITLTSDLSITAVYTINTYTVTLTADADTAYSDSIIAEHGTPLADILPEIPAKTGYTGVWKIGGTVTVSGDITLTSDLSITAVYTADIHLITFVNSFYGTSENKEIAYDTLLTSELPEIAAREGYTGRWTYNGDNITDDMTVIGDMTLEVVYTINTYTLTVSVTDNEDTSKVYTNTLTADHGENLLTVLAAIEEELTKTAYNMIWTADGADVSEDTLVTSDLAVSARYEIKTFTVTFDSMLNTSNRVTEKTVEYGSTTVLPNVSYVGYTVRWMYNGEEFTSSTPVYADITVEAHWFTDVTFTAAEADTPYSETINAEKDSSLAAILPEVPIKTGYNGVWTYNGAEVTSDTAVTVVTGMTITASYTPVTYTLTLNSEADSSYSETISAAYDQPLTEALADKPTPEVTGKTGRWTYNGNDITEDMTVTGDMTITAKYEIRQCKVTFNDMLDSAGSIIEITVEYGSTTAPPNVSYEGYTVKWMYNGEEFTSSTPVYDDITVEAHWFADVIFTADADTAYSETITAEKDSSLAAILPKVPEKTGYTGVWTYNGAEVTSDTTVTVVSDMTITASYTPITYTLTLNSEVDSSYSETVQAEYGKLLLDVLPATPEVTGYNSGRWTYNGNDITADMTVTGDMTITAAYTLNTYTVSFYDVVQEVIVHTETVSHNGTVQSVPVLEDIEEASGRYVGVWVYSDDTEFKATDLITSDLQLTSYYKAVITVTFNMADGSTTSFTIPSGTSLADNGYSVPSLGSYNYWVNSYGSQVDVSSYTVFNESVTYTEFEVTIAGDIEYVYFYDTDGTALLSTLEIVGTTRTINSLYTYSGSGELDHWVAFDNSGNTMTVTDSTTVGDVWNAHGIVQLKAVLKA